MKVEQYRALFHALGIEDVQIGHVLRHRGQSMRLYFNHKQSIGVNFIAHLSDEHLYPDRLWDRIAPALVKSKDRPEQGMLPIVPRPGFERRAFENLMDRPFGSDLLQQAFDKASELPESQQDEFARFLLAELDSERRWDELFSLPESDDLLDRLVDDALAAHKAGRTRPLDPAEL